MPAYEYITHCKYLALTPTTSCNLRAYPTTAIITRFNIKYEQQDYYCTTDYYTFLYCQDTTYHFLWSISSCTKFINRNSSFGTCIQFNIPRNKCPTTLLRIKPIINLQINQQIPICFSVIESLTWNWRVIFASLSPLLFKFVLYDSIVIIHKCKLQYNNLSLKYAVTQDAWQNNFPEPIGISTCLWEPQDDLGSPGPLTNPRSMLVKCW